MEQRAFASLGGKARWKNKSKQERKDLMAIVTKKRLNKLHKPGVDNELARKQANGNI